MKTIHKIKIDLLTPGLRSRVYVVQDDICTREVQISLYSGGASWSPAKASAAVGYSKPDGTTGLYDSLPDGSAAISISGNVVTVILAAQMLTCAGTVEAAVTLADANGNQISTFAFDVIVSANPGSSAVKSEDYFNYVNPRIRTVIEGAEKATTAANAAADRANAASVVAYQANEKVDTLREVVSKLHSNIVETASGKVITVSDSAEAPLQGLKVFGKTEQRTTTGKNLLNYDAWNAVPINKGTAVFENNGVTLTASQDDCYTHYQTITGYPESAKIPVQEGDTITVSWEATSNVSGLVGVFMDGGATKFKTADNANVRQLSYTVPAGYTFVTIRFGVAKAGNTITYKNIMVERSPVATTYEPYTGGIPSPNPEYPQALESVGDSGSVTTTVWGKNRMSGFTGTKENPYSITAVRDDHAIILKETSAYMEAGKPYTFSIYTDGIWGNENGSDTVEWLLMKDGAYECFYDSIGSVQNGERISKTIIPQATGLYSLRLDVNKNGATHSFWDAQVEEGTQATEYEPYNGGSVTVSTPNGLPGIPVTSGGNYTDPVTKQQWICDEVDFEKGVYVQRVAANVLDGTENWLYNSAILNGTGQNFYCVPSEKWNDHDSTISNDTRILSTAFTGGSYRTAINAIAIDKNYLNISVSAEKFPNVSALKEALAASPVGFQYILAKENHIPLSEIDPDALAQYAALHTNYPNTTIYNDAGAHMEVSYIADTQKYVDKKFEALEAAIANLI